MAPVSLREFRNLWLLSDRALEKNWVFFCSNAFNVQIVELSQWSISSSLILEIAPSRFSSAIRSCASIFLTRRSNDSCKLKLKVSQAATWNWQPGSSAGD